MKKLLLLVPLFLVACTQNRKTSEKTHLTYSVKLNDKYLVSENEYAVTGQFDILFESETLMDGVFVIPAREKIDIEQYLGKDVDNTIFSVGNMFIFEREQLRSLSFNSNYSSNWLPNESGSNCFSASIKNFGDLESNQKIDKLYCYFYCDLNKDKVVTENEIQKITLHLSRFSFPKDEKIYVSTFGYRITDYYKVQNGYTVYHITSPDGYRKFKEEVADDNYLNCPFDDERFKESNFYIVLSPKTKSLFLEQPYRYNSSDLLIFDVNEKYDSKSEYIAARNYYVKKEKDSLTICINLNGTIIYPERIEY